MKNKRNNTSRILAQGELMSNDTWATGINNNDLIIGPSGAGKTRGYVKPNILQCSESMVVADTKGDLIGEFGPFLRKRGYRVLNIDLTDTLRSDGYNPLDYIRYDPKQDKYSEQDILTLCAALVPLGNLRDPYWERSARTLLASLVAYVLECLPEEEHTLEYVVKLFTTKMACPEDESRVARAYHVLMGELGQEDPDSYAYQQYQFYSMVRGAHTTDACILSTLAEKLAPLTYDGPIHMYSSRERIDFRTLGRQKTAVFLTISDTDRSMDALANVFYTQAMHALCNSADKDYPDHRLPVPVRFILDDFATNVRIPDFDKLISVIRSREIYVSIILQSISQLYTIYSESAGMTIINNCDNCLYLGGQDVDTARYISTKANKTTDTILNMPLDKAYLFTRGQRPKAVTKYDVTTHEAYGKLSQPAAETFEKEVEPWDKAAVSGRDLVAEGDRGPVRAPLYCE